MGDSINMLDEDEVRDLNVPGGGDADNERRVRREIANSNERRRMQSIKAGFQSLRTLLPHHEGEKLSKAAILQQTAEYIYQLEQEKTRLLSQNSQLKRLYSLSQQGLNQNSNHDQDSTTSPRLKKKKIALESTTTTTELLKEDEYPQGSSTSTTPSVAELSMQLLNEQRLRMRLEERLKTLEQNSATTPILPIRHLEGDHLFSEDSHKVVKEEVVEFHTTGPLAPQPPTAASLSHHVTVTKNLVPSKINPIPATLLPTQPQHKEKSNSIIIVKQCQT